VQPSAHPRRRLIFANLEDAACGLGLHPDAPPRDERAREGGFTEVGMLRTSSRAWPIQSAARAAHTFGRRSAPRYPVRRCGPTRKEHAPWGGAHNAINVNATSVTADEVIE